MAHTEKLSVNADGMLTDDEISYSLASGVNVLTLDDEMLKKAKNQAEDQQEGEATEECPTFDDPQQAEIIDLRPPMVWTIKDIAAFKREIKSKSPTNVLKIGHGETATVRAPAHASGAKLVWEFATDHYDLGFGVYFEWTISENDCITVQISESDDEGDEDDEEEGVGTGGDDGEKPAPQGAEDVEVSVGPVPSYFWKSVTSSGMGVPITAQGGHRKPRKPQGPPTDEILPVLRRDCHLEAQAGSHDFSGQGVYVLKFDNTYSLWRSKWLYYRVYYISVD